MNGWIPKNHGGLEPMIFHPQLASPFPPRGKTASFNKALVRGSWCFKMHQIIGLDISWGFAWGPFFSRIKMSWNSWPMGARRKAHLVANNPKNKDGNEKLCKSGESVAVPFSHLISMKCMWGKFFRPGNGHGCFLTCNFLTNQILYITDNIGYIIYT